MMIVMKQAATEEEIRAVIDRIESVGARAHPSTGDEVTVIGAIGDLEHIARLGAPRIARRRPRRSHPQALQAGQRAAQARRAHRARHRRAQDRRRALRAHRRPLHRRVARADADDRRRRGGRRGDDVPRRRLQAAHEPVRLPGAGAGGLAPPGRGRGADRPADRHRADGRARPRARARGGRRHPDRRAQHAELPAAGRDRPLRAARCSSSAGCRARSRSCSWPPSTSSRRATRR